MAKYSGLINEAADELPPEVLDAHGRLPDRIAELGGRDVAASSATAASPASATCRRPRPTSSCTASAATPRPRPLTPTKPRSPSATTRPSRRS